MGGGVVGLSTAWNLARRGLRVVVFDRGPLAGEASWLNFGGVRQSNRDPRELPLAMLATRLWERLDADLEASCGYRQSGNLRVALDEEELEVLRASVEPQRAGGLDVRWLDGDAARDIAPSLSNGVLGATYCPSDGQTEPVQTMPAWIAAARRAGVRLCPHTEVRQIRLRGGRVDGLETSAGEVGTPVVLNAAGPWSPGIGELVGARHPVDPWLAEVVQFRPPQTVPAQFISWRRLSFRMAADGLLWSGLSSRPHGRFARGAATREGLELLRAMGSAILDPLASARPLQGWSGLTEWTPDGVPIIDARSGPPGYVVATGFSGHGFALGPAIGRVTAQLILGDTPDVDLEAFRNDRFGEADRVGWSGVAAAGEPGGLEQPAWTRPYW